MRQWHLQIMHPTIKFYSQVLQYIKSDIEDNETLEKIVTLAKTVTLSLAEVTAKNISFLETCVNRPSEVPESEDDGWLATIESFVQCAFKDLSPLRDEKAMQLWHQINEKLLVGSEGDLFVWSRRVKSRPDGSAVIVLHVSNQEAFERILSEIGYEGTLSDCALFRNAGWTRD